MFGRVRVPGAEGEGEQVRGEREAGRRGASGGPPYPPGRRWRGGMARERGASAVSRHSEEEEEGRG